MPKPRGVLSPSEPGAGGGVLSSAGRTIGGVLSDYGDWYARGGVSGMLGMAPWDQQAPEDIAMGFAGGGVGAIKQVGEKTLGQLAASLAKKLGATKIGEGLNYARLSGDKLSKSRYYKMAGGRELRISDHSNVSGNKPDIDVVLNRLDGVAEIHLPGGRVEIIERGHAAQPAKTMFGETYGPYQATGFAGDEGAWLAAVEEYLGGFK